MITCDALSLAAATAYRFFSETNCEPTWGDLSICRLLGGGGWLVEYSRYAMMFDDEKVEAHVS